MPITDEQGLVAAVAEASALLQSISDYLNDHPDQQHLGRVRFPRGFIGTAVQKRQSLPFIADRRLKANISYALMTHDVLRWIVNRTDISGQAKEMMIKESVCLLGSVCESITVFPGEYGLGRGAGFRGRITRLRDNQIIDNDCFEDLEWLWAKRNQEHIVDNLFYEFSHYTTADWNRSARGYVKLRRALTAWRAA